MYAEVNMLSTSALLLIFMMLIVASHSKRLSTASRRRGLLHRERRAYPRYDTSLRIKYRGQSCEGVSWIKDISMGGARLFLNDSLKNIEMGAPLEIEINLPYDAQSVSIKGNIVWSKDSDAGFRFGDILQGDISKIMHYVTSAEDNKARGHTSDLSPS